MHFSLVALGYNINFALLPGITECLGGDEIELNKNIWETNSQYGKYLTLGGRLSTDIVFSKKFSIETGIEYKNVERHTFWNHRGPGRGVDESPAVYSSLRGALSLRPH